ncbi:MAG: integrase [Nitrososphaerota archaeon]
MAEKDPSPLLSLIGKRRLRAMKAISNLSKFLGFYDEWRKMIRAYGLKWSEGGFSFMTFFSQPFPVLLNECREMIKILNGRFENEIHFMSLSGLRPSEALLAIKVFHEKGEAYLNERLMVLEHYKFPEIFFRGRSKKTFITILDEKLLEALQRSKPISYNMLRSYIRRRSRVKLNYFRKLYATFLRQEGILPEIIDLVQGRIPSNVFFRNYFRPDIERVIEEIRGHLDKLRRLLFMRASSSASSYHPAE